MNIGILFLKSNLTGIITFSELDWITTHLRRLVRAVVSIPNMLRVVVMVPVSVIVDKVGVDVLPGWRD